MAKKAKTGDVAMSTPADPFGGAPAPKTVDAEPVEMEPAAPRPNIVVDETRVLVGPLLRSRSYDNVTSNIDNDRREGATGVVLDVAGPTPEDLPDDEWLTVKHDDEVDKLTARYLLREIEVL